MLLKLCIASVFAFTALADQSIIPLIQDLTKDAVALNQTLYSFNGGLGDLLPLTTAANALVADTNNGVATVGKAATLSFDDSIRLAQVTLQLKTDATQMVDTLIARKPQFDKLPGATVVLKGILNNLKSGIQALGEAIVAKVPDEIKPAATKLVSLLVDQIDRALAVYK